MLPQQWSRATHHTGCLDKIDWCCNILELSDYRMVEFGKEPYFVEVGIIRQVAGITGHGDRDSHRLPPVKQFGLPVLHIPYYQAWLKFVSVRSTFKTIQHSRVIRHILIFGKQSSRT